MDNLRKVLNRLTQLASINHHCYLVSFFAQCRGVLFSDWQDDGAGKMRHSQHDSPLTPSPLSSSMKGKIFCILMPWELEKKCANHAFRYISTLLPPWRRIRCEGPEDWVVEKSANQGWKVQKSAVSFICNACDANFLCFCKPAKYCSLGIALKKLPASRLLFIFPRYWLCRYTVHIIYTVFLRE